MPKANFIAKTIISDRNPLYLGLHSFTHIPITLLISAQAHPNDARQGLVVGEDRVVFGLTRPSLQRQGGLQDPKPVLIMMAVGLSETSDRPNMCII